MCNVTRVVYDNSTLERKVSLRRNLLAECVAPVVLEAYGGFGKLWQQCYAHIKNGVVIEKSPEKTDALVMQRPTWAVYEADCVAALRAGVGSHLEVDFADFDAYGAPWNAIDAFFESERHWPDKLALVATDGMRHKLKYQGGFDVAQLAAAVRKYGNAAMHEHYAAICRELMAEKAARRGYEIARWACYHCGHSDAMTHYAAILTRV